MQPLETSYETIVDEDLQIMRATLQVMSEDLSPCSARAAEKLREAVCRIDEARAEIQKLKRRREPSTQG